MYSIIQKQKKPALILIALWASLSAFAQTGSTPKVTAEDTNISSVGDVVIVGYGRQSRRNLVGSISTVSGKDITDMPAPSFEAALQGKAAGVQVIVGSGMAGSASLIRIRGASSISAAGDPLYVIDGIPISQDYFMNRANGSNYGAGFNNNPLASINPDDIENIEILKDAAATSIYGSRGANGVILITTKRAKKKGLKFCILIIPRT
jgi:TonB-dependent SusC/RagA subfamily outer membrane receptor